MTFGGIASDSQMVKSRKENKYPYDDDRNGAVWMLKTKKKRTYCCRLSHPQTNIAYRNTVLWNKT